MVLTQCDDERKEFVVAHASHSNNVTESRYSSYEEECLVAVRAVAHFKCYLFGTQFTLVTNHQPFKWLMEFDKLTGKLARWVFILQDYDFHVVHRPGIANLDADGFSRNPCSFFAPMNVLSVAVPCPESHTKTRLPEPPSPPG